MYVSVIRPFAHLRGCPTLDVARWHHLLIRNTVDDTWYYIALRSAGLFSSMYLASCLCVFLYFDVEVTYSRCFGIRLRWCGRHCRSSFLSWRIQTAGRQANTLTLSFSHFWHFFHQKVFWWMRWWDVGCSSLHELQNNTSVFIYLSYDTAALLFWRVLHFLLVFF